MGSPVRFSVRWSVGQRFALALPMLLFFAFGAILSYYFWFDANAMGQAEPGELWAVRVLGLLFAWGGVYVLSVLRYAVWLDDETLVRQGALLRRRISLRGATFGMKETTWQYTKRLGPVNLVRVNIRAPTLLVRSSALRRIALPLAQRTGHRVIDNRVVVSWLPPEQLGPLADAIDTYAGAPNKDKVVRFLRHVGRSFVQPTASLDSPF